MSSPVAKAFPRKRFFLDMFTRDIFLDDCILDLIDNSIDSLIRRDHIDIADKILSSWKPRTTGKQRALPRIDVRYDKSSFSISDNCGGISRNDARTDSFNFGHAQHVSSDRRLGAYGIGMKRAIFKIGNSFKIESKTPEEGFSMDVNVEEWAKKDDSPNDWVFPMKYIQGSKSRDSAGTKIVIQNFSESVAMAFDDRMLHSRLVRQIGKIYSLFLGRFVNVYLNDAIVNSTPIPLGESENVQPSISLTQDGKVKVKIIATFAAKGDKGTWEGDSAGWYVLCNGRVILSADKSEMTGWGAGILPQFQPKFRGFVGLVSFYSDDPLTLPWTTTKRALDRDAPTYQRIRSKMGATAKPIIRTLEKFYSPEKDESADERRIADDMQQADVISISTRPESTFKLTTPNKSLAKKTTTQISFPAKITDVEKVRKYLRNSKMSKARIGEYVFDYFMKSEGLR